MYTGTDVLIAPLALRSEPGMFPAMEERATAFGSQADRSVPPSTV